MLDDDNYSPCSSQKTCSSNNDQDTISENNTYFTSSGISKGSQCTLTVCKVSSNVCQLRLDFETFVLNLVGTKFDISNFLPCQPITTYATTAVNGNIANAGAYTLGQSTLAFMEQSVGQAAGLCGNSIP